MFCRYKMPLLEVIGFTCTGHNFSVAYAFMAHENEESYAWVLRNLQHLFNGKVPNAIMTDRELGLIAAVKEVYPDVQHLLCWVHVLRSCEEAALDYTGDPDKVAQYKSECRGLFMSRTNETYQSRKKGMYARWGMYPKLMSHLEGTWLMDYHTNIVCAFTDHVLHFGTRSTNRAESAHSMLKTALNCAQGDFITVVDAIHRTVTHQIHEVKGHLEMARYKSPHPGPLAWLFSRVIDVVSVPCFNLLQGLYKKVAANQYDVLCNDKWFTTSLGIPCAHDIADCLLTQTPIMPGQIHPFWKQLCWDGQPGEDPEDFIPLNASQVISYNYTFLDPYDLAHIH